MRTRTSDFIRALVEVAAAPYRSSGRFAWHFARGKLRRDPVFVGLLKHGLIPDRARILDIGCGQGLLASWLLAAKAVHNNPDGAIDWPELWPPAPGPVSIHGIELMPRDVQRAQQTLGKAATFTVGDMCISDFGKTDVVVIMDVLHYVSIAAQTEILARAREALAPKGTLILRIGDASGGIAFKFGIWVDYVVAFIRGHRNIHFSCRTLTEWNTALTELGFTVDTIPMNEGTPFSNILLVARLTPNSAR